MTARRVEVTSDAFYGCVTHALSTEMEEVMGLLVGDVDNDHVVRISVILPLRRMDKRKDRVEPSPEQLCAAAVQAEAWAMGSSGRQHRVIGWYHSHPHITSMPSHVDCGTQFTIQRMDKDFIGIIISCFHTKTPSEPYHRVAMTDAVDRVQVTCFQAAETRHGHVSCHVPLDITPTAAPSQLLADQLVQIPNLLFKEEQSSLEASLAQTGDKDVIALLQNISVYTQALCSIMDIFAIPMLHSLQSCLSEYERRKVSLRKEKQDLEKRLKVLRRTKTITEV
ncbi:lys-63-specific deubiquitinase BRCC36-like [Sycon ciliatum]|uniref:lys-63-specific deubiquitinase BRCC36-like n=1 Tax=Sycon ciliatum TaxID=27933 RepID=UPI0020A93F2D|eukprot:scpid76988/ scgid11463/ Lys-63-specific deubiquitinase BRCC36; BRCA1-A complex subunit BRCC36; BRCA1/BRCA2-containing complex subunit 3; BRCA1/BRCA2-containing complex subunit 36; BRISC complex subunit BRCC36